MGSLNLDAVAASIADAAVDPSQWARALNSVARQTQSFGSFLVPVAGHTAIPNLPISEKMNNAVDAYFRGGWHLRDHRMRGLNVMLSVGVVDDLDIAPFDEIQRSAYYQDFLAPVGLRWFAGVRVACGDDIWCLSIQRTLNQTPFSPKEKGQLAALSVQLSSAAAIAKALGFASANAAMEAFEVSRTGALLLNRAGEVIKANQAAERLFVDDLKISSKRLSTGNPDVTAALDRALQRLLWNRNTAALSEPIALPRTGKRPILAYLLKLSAMTRNAFSDGQAIIVLADLEKRWRPPETILRTSFGLTIAEAKLASAIASGSSLEGVADELGITKQTSRNHLKSIFHKVGVHRQAELVSIFARLLRGS